MVDGTKVRLQQTDEKGHGKKVEMRWALASLGEKQKFDLNAESIVMRRGES